LGYPVFCAHDSHRIKSQDLAGFRLTSYGKAQHDIICKAQEQGTTFMQRLALAIIAVAIVTSLIALLARSVARSFEDKDGLSAVATGDTMQKAAFFVLLCLILYVSVSGAS
jgi:hypothetical protein